MNKISLATFIMNVLQEERYVGQAESGADSSGIMR